MGPASFPALQRAHGMDRKARNRRELVLCEARSLAERFELRAKCPRSARFHGPFILLLRLYGRRTSPVRVLSVVTISLALHTGDMAGDAGATAFVTGAAGFIGIELVKVLMARGHQVFGLTRSLEGAHRVRRAGAVPVMGDLLEPGQWQDEAAADWVFHLPPHPVRGARVTRRRAASITRARVLMDAHLLDAVAAGATRRIVYVADTSGYGATGSCPITEDEPPQPSAWGRCLTPALDRLDGYVVAGLPIVTAFPGWVYGNASWFRELVIEPIMAGRRVLQFGKTGPWVSPIHIHDCARALVHLAEYIQADVVFSNIRLRGIGFRFQYPTLEQGLQQVIGALNE